jgi:hypothetical protein
LKADYFADAGDRPARWSCRSPTQTGTGPSTVRTSPRRITSSVTTYFRLVLNTLIATAGDVDDRDL